MTAPRCTDSRGFLTARPEGLACGKRRLLAGGGGCVALLCLLPHTLLPPVDFSGWLAGRRCGKYAVRLRGDAAVVGGGAAGVGLLRLVASVAWLVTASNALGCGSVKVRVCRELAAFLMPHFSASPSSRRSVLAPRMWPAGRRLHSRRELSAERCGQELSL
jgi:hypothetical protein